MVWSFLLNVATSGIFQIGILLFTGDTNWCFMEVSQKKRSSEVRGNIQVALRLEHKLHEYWRHINTQALQKCLLTNRDLFMTSLWKNGEEKKAVSWKQKNTK